MNLRYVFILSIALVILSAVIQVKAEDGTLTNLNPWKLTGSIITPRNASNSLQVPSLGTTTASLCLTTNASGTFSLVSCSAGGGGGGGATTTILGVNGPTFTFNVSGNNGLSYSTSSQTITLTQATATASQSGFLSSGDWTTFNNKLSAALTSLNGSTSSTQTFATSTGTNAWTITTTNGVHTFKIPSNVGFFTNDAGYLTAALTSLDGITSSTQTFSRTNDTNVTLTLSTTTNGVHNFVLGWSGQLANSRGGTGLDTSASTGFLSLGSGVWAVNNTSTQRTLLGLGTLATINSPTPYANGGTATTTSWTSGSILFASTTAISQDNSNLFWDFKNTRLGLGTTTPATTLHIIGQETVSQTSTVQNLKINSLSGSTVCLHTVSNVVSSTNADCGTVTSITAGTGLSGGTITGAGTISLSTPVSIANGGTNGTLAATAFNNLTTSTVSMSFVAGGTTIPDMASGTVQKVTLTAATTTIGAPKNLASGMRITYFVGQDSTGGRTVTWNSVYKFPGGVAPVLSTTTNSTDTLSFASVDGTNLQCTGFSADAK
jgi:trimeric autotransporter adhesin